MEDTLRVRKSQRTAILQGVLILVLMEDTLRVGANVDEEGSLVVLILVLMEDTLREQRLVFLCLSSFDVCLPLWK